MKLHTLEIHNIASLVEASIDFSSPELSSEPIFLVTGDTGSGKTSILNSICIALYNQVPALDEAGKDEDNHGVKIGSPLQLVRRNCKESSIALTFSDKEGTYYTVDWRASRITRGARKGEFNGSAIQRTLSIIHKDGRKEHYSRLRDVTEQIEKSLGLTFEQFCRTTMLAQGQFLKFINSDKKNKSEILEKITGTEIYSQVGQRVYAITKARKETFSALSNQIAGAQLLSDEEKNQLAEQVEVLGKSIDEKTKTFAEIENYEKWLEDASHANVDLEKAKNDLASQRTEEKSQMVKQLAKVVEDWEQTDEIRGIIAESLKANQEYGDANANVAAQRPKFAALAQGLAHVAKSIDDYRQQIAANAVDIEAQKQYEPVYSAEGQVLTLIGVIEDEAEKIGQCERRIGESQRALSQAKAELEKEQRVVGVAKKKLDEQQAEVDRLTKDGEGIDAKVLNQKKNEASQRLDIVNKAIDAYKALTDSETDLANKVDEAAKIEEQLEANKTEQDKAISERDKLKAESDDAVSRLRGQMDLSDRLVELTHIFKDTHACPLCGTEVQHLHTKDFIDQAVNEANAVAEQAKKAYSEAVEIANDLASTVKSGIANLKKVNAEAEKLRELTKERRKAFEAFDIKTDVLQTQYDEAKALVDSLSEALSQALIHDAALKSAIGERDKRRRSVDAAQSQLEKSKSNVEGIEKKINADAVLVLNLSDSKQTNVSKLGDLLAMAPHPQLQVDDLAGIKASLPKLKTNYDALIDRKSKLSDNLAKLESNKLEVEEKLAQVENFFGVPDPMAEPKVYPNIVKETTLFSANAIRLGGQIEAIDRRRKELVDKENAYFTVHSKDETLAIIDSLKNETAEAIAAKRKQISDYDLKVANLQGKVDQLTARLAELGENRPASLPDELTLQQAKDDKAAAKAEIEALSQQKAKSAGMLEQNAEREKSVARLKVECDRVQKEYYKWECLNKLLGTESGDKLRNLAQAYIFGLLLQSANRFMAQLTDRYTLEGETGSLVIYVIDHHDGGNKRVAKGLSGGEGFMASLSLALALSAINQDLDPLDILFIDEGFGALDPSAREFTIDMLCSLQRRVCVISHMPELRECIPTQILVKRQPGTSRAALEIKTCQ